MKLVNFTPSNEFNPPRKFERIVIIGNTGAGKTTLSYLLAQKMGYKVLNLDYYRDKTRVNKTQRKNRTAQEVSRRKLQKIVRNHTYRNKWIIDGDYNYLREIIWGKSDLIIWLDYSPLYLLLINLRRSIMRVFFLKNIGEVEIMVYKKVLNHYKNTNKIDLILKECRLLSRICKHYVEKKVLLNDLKKYSIKPQKMLILKNVEMTKEWLKKQ